MANKIPLYPGESIVYETGSATSRVIVTNLRVVRFWRVLLGDYDALILPLENIDFIEKRFYSQPGQLIFGCLLFGLGSWLYQGTPERWLDGSLGLTALGLILMFSYLFTRHHGVHLHTAKSTIFMAASQKNLTRLVHAVETARWRRMAEIHGVEPPPSALTLEKDTLLVSAETQVSNPGTGGQDSDPSMEQGESGSDPDATAPRLTPPVGKPAIRNS
ncbi:MAG: hypothetical protein GMKNLPBB_02192 [Myxococcota bacterium]|nr:hypothetical protein [Myxococcota bacterium]